MNYNFRKFKKNAKGLSPVVASIILIAVTVAVSVVVAAWLSGMAFGFMGSAEQASITNVALTDNTVAGTPVTYTGTAVCTVQNKGSATTTIASATIDGNAAALGTTTTIAKGGQASITLTIPSTGSSATAPFVDGAQYVIKLQTSKGNSITYTATYVTP